MGGDLHLQHLPPIVRSAEPNWYYAMERTVKQLTELCNKHRAPLVLPGDIFTKWNNPPELVNFALDILPFSYGIPGNHDLPYHAYGEKHRSSYWTLVHAGRVKHLEPYIHIMTKRKDLVLTGFPCGFALQANNREPYPDLLHLAVAHAYCWIEGYSYPDANKEDQATRFKKKLKGFDAICTGDNHIGFLASKKIPLFNGGTMMRRTIDEIHYQPRVGLLHESGKITRVDLDCSLDKFIDVKDIAKAIDELPDSDDFVTELAQLVEGGLNFVRKLTRALEKGNFTQAVKQYLRQTLEEVQK